MPTSATLSADQSDEIRLLRAEYFDASKRAAEAIQVGTEKLDPLAIKILLVQTARAAKAIRRVKEIYGL
jgi:hypothetical protein